MVFDPKTIHRRRLPNGLTAIVREDHSAPVVAIVTHLKVGYLDEPDELAGISHVLEHMFFKGTPTRGPGEIAQATKAAGGYINASTSYERTIYYTVLPADSFQQGLEIEADALINSVIDAEELRRELQVIIQEAKRKFDNPDAVAAEGLYELMFDRHRMRRWRIGTEAFLNSLTREQLWSFYREQYRGDRAIVVVAGDVDPERTHELIARLFGPLESGGQARDLGPEEPEHCDFRFVAKTADIVQARLELGWRGAHALHRDTPALDMLSIILGQGRASRLYRNVREAGLVSSIDARNYSPATIGVFGIGAELKTEHATAALEAIASSVEGVRTTIDAAEVDRARSILEARALRRVESMEGQANHLAEWEGLGDWQLGEAYLDDLARITADDVRNAAIRYLDPGAASVFFYQPNDAGETSMSAEQVQAYFRGALPSAPILASIQPRTLSSGRASLTGREDQVHRYRTSSGVNLVIEPRRAVPLVSIAIAAVGGANREPARLAGITGLVARTSVKGTRHRSALQLAIETEALGSAIGPSALPDLFDWYTTVPARHFERAVDLLTDVALNPAFEEEELERERTIALADLDQVRDDMYRYPMRLFMQKAFAGHPYGLSLEGVEAGVRTVTAQDLREWHSHSIEQGGLTAFVVGDVDPDRAAAALGAIEARTAAPSTGPIPHWPDDGAVIEADREKAQTAIALGYPACDRNHPDQYALQVLSSTIAGLGGRLFEELRSRRSLAYTVAASPMARQLGGAFIAYIATSPEREDEATRGLLEELDRVRQHLLPVEDVERAKRYLIGTWQIRSQPNGARLTDILHALLIGEGLSELREYEDRIAAVTVEEIRDAAQRYFDDRRLVRAVVRGTGGAR